MKPLITVIVPIYNAEKYLNVCINSIVNQTYKNLEIFLINDGSNDNSLLICNQWSCKDNRIKVINKENSGVSDSRNIGLELANGEYISFIDSDDYINLSMYEELIKQIETKNPDVTIFGFNAFDEKNSESFYGINYTQTSFLSEEFLKTEFMFTGGSFVYLWNKLFKKSCIDTTRFNSNMNYGEDLLFIFEILKKTSDWFYVNKIYYNYRINLSNSLSKNLNRDFCYKTPSIVYEIGYEYHENDKFIDNFSNYYMWQLWEVLNDSTNRIINRKQLILVRKKFLYKNIKFFNDIVSLKYLGIKFKIIKILFHYPNLIKDYLLVLLIYFNYFLKYIKRNFNF